jgi:hypothetical protein
MRGLPANDHLSADERAHLYALAQAVDPDPPDDGPAADHAEALERMLAVFDSVPAVPLGRCTTSAGSRPPPR